MSIASLADVEAALGRPTTEGEVGSLIEEASDLIVGYLGEVPSDATGQVPGAVTRVVARMVARVLRRGPSGAEGVTQTGRTMGPFSEQYTFAEGSTSGAPWLDKGDKVKLRPFLTNGGMQSVSMVGEHTGRYRRFV